MTPPNSYRPVHDHQGNRIEKLYVRGNGYAVRSRHPITRQDWWIPMGRIDPEIDAIVGAEDRDENLRLNAHAINTFVSSVECRELLQPSDLYEEITGDTITEEDAIANLRAQIEAFVQALDFDREDEKVKDEAFVKLFYTRVLIFRALDALMDVTLDAGYTSSTGYANAWGYLSGVIDEEAREAYSKKRDEEWAKSVLDGTADLSDYTDEGKSQERERARLLLDR
jgi:hypothetical protein